MLTTSDDSKADAIASLGARGFINYRTEPDWGRVASGRFGGFDHVITALGSAALDQSIAASAAGGEVVTVASISPASGDLGSFRRE